MEIPKSLFNQKKYDAAMEEYTKGLYGIPTGSKADKPKKRPVKRKATKTPRKK